MRIVLDLQACQTSSSRFRGIGRYSWALATAMMKRGTRHEFRVALNATFPESVKAIRRNLQSLVPAEHIVTWEVPCPTAAELPDNRERASRGEVLREAFIESLQPDLVHISSVFEGWADDALASVPSAPSAVPAAVTLYDLIPLVHRSLYLRHPVSRDFYYHCLDSLRRARLLLAISDFTRKEAIGLLGLSPDRVVSISTAADAIFAPKAIHGDAQRAFCAKFCLSRPFVMYTGGIDHRKNIEGLIRAFATLPPALRGAHQLVLVCKVHDAERTRLLDLARGVGLGGDDLVLTGYVSDDDLIALYNLCKLFVFPSWHEGFGLPALEAMACGAAVIASNTSSLPEVVGRADALFDPRKDEAIGGLMQKVLQDDAFRHALKEHGLARAKLFSWDESARRALEAMEAVHEERGVARSPKLSRKPRLAYVSPLPPERTGIADYSAELLPKLAQHYDIELISDQAEITGSTPGGWPWRSCEWFDRHADRYDRVLYQFGNSSFHVHMFDLLSRHPGTVVLHDFYLGHIIRHMEYTEMRANFWVDALYRSHGYPPLVAVRDAPYPGNEVVQEYPCNWGVLRQADGVIVHSEFCRKLAKHWYGQSAASRIVQISLLRESRDQKDRGFARNALCLPQQAFVTISLGIVDPVKLCDRLVAAWGRSRLSVKAPESLLIFVGDSHDKAYAESLATQAAALGIAERVRIVGYVEKDIYDMYLAAADVVVQLRTRSRGETSAAILDALGSGRPVIVNVHGTAAELPDEVVCKLPDEFSEKDLVSALESLWRDGARRRELGMRGREHLVKVHDPATIALQYQVAIEEFSTSSPHAQLRKITHELMERVSGLTPEPGDLERAAQTLAETVVPCMAQRQLLVDVSQLAITDAGSGIRRVLRGVLSELLNTPPAGMRVEPVYAAVGESGGVYRYARAFTARFLGLADPPADDELLDVTSGDEFLGLDLVPGCEGYLHKLRRQGVDVHVVVYDELPDEDAFVSAIVNWLGHAHKGELPEVTRLKPLTWRASTKQLFDAFNANDCSSHARASGAGMAGTFVSSADTAGAARP